MGNELSCSVCGVVTSWDAAPSSEWSPSWVDRGGNERDPICPFCIDALGLVVDDDGELTFPSQAVYSTGCEECNAGGLSDCLHQYLPTDDPLDPDDPAPM